MPICRADVVLPFFTATPTDICQNTFHFVVTEFGDTALDSIVLRLNAFYDGVYSPTGTDRVAYVDWPLATVKMFNLDDPTPRVPVIENLGITGAGANLSTVPTEVAAVLSWHAAPESGVAYQRLYNRIFLGCLPSSAMAAAAVDAFPTLASAFVTKIQNAAIALKGADGSGATWVQRSTAGGVGVSREIVGGWVDNSPDTQRRRGVLASSRNPWTP